MADYLPEPQFSYTKQLEAYDALIEKRKRKQKWGNVWNNLAAFSDPTHVTSGAFGRNEKRIAGAYGDSLSQESKRLSLLGKAEKEGIHQEISRRLQDATKKYSMSSKSEFDAWFETLGPHFTGEYKKYFDIWNAGVKVKRLEVEDLRKEARFGWDRLKQDQDQAKLAAAKVKEADAAFKDAEVDKLYLDNLNEYASYYNDLQMGVVSGQLNLTKLRTKIAEEVQAQDWSNDIKEAVLTGAWSMLNKAVTGSEVVPTTKIAFAADESQRKITAANTTRLQKTANRKAKTAYATFVADNKPENLEQYVDYHRQLSDQLDAINYAGTYAEDSDTKALMDKFEKRYKGWEAQRSKRYDPEKIPSYRVAVDVQGNWDFVTNEMIQKSLDSEGNHKEGGWKTPEGEKKASARGRPGQKFFTLAYEMSANREDKDKFMAVVNKIFDEGLLGITDADEAKIVQEILKEVNLRAQKREESGLAALKALLEGESTPTTVADESELQARIRQLKAAGISREATRRILIEEGLIDG